MVAPAQPMLKGKSEDMGSLRGPRKPKAETKKGSLNPMQIIQQSAKKELGPNADTNPILNGIAAIIQMKMGQLVQIGNTVFFIMPKGGGTVEFHIFTVENPENLIKQFKAAAKTFKGMGFNRAVSYSENPVFVKMAQQTGLPVKIAQGNQNIGGKMKPTYQFVVDL